jgi:hypothetical protein
VTLDEEIAALRREVATLKANGIPAGTLEEWRLTMGDALNAWFLSVEALRKSESAASRKLHDEARNEVYRVHKIIKSYWFGGISR